MQKFFSTRLRNSNLDLNYCSSILSCCSYFGWRPSGRPICICCANRPTISISFIIICTSRIRCATRRVRRTIRVVFWLIIRAIIVRCAIVRRLISCSFTIRFQCLVTCSSIWFIRIACLLITVRILVWIVAINNWIIIFIAGCLILMSSIIFINLWISRGFVISWLYSLSICITRIRNCSIIFINWSIFFVFFVYDRLNSSSVDIITRRISKIT
ncbi:unnamed protein product [Moneuplotes crassus]|uniref:Uncharacterized protein n=1 Tax=Euplotes crassus TaxID=5936 RepID=A0AAD1Y4C4_EUPCR|nr:unnamed protein product [Moneuplotes crassus]